MGDFEDRFMAAKAHRAEYIDDAAREVYKFCFNGREREWDEKRRVDDEPEEVFTEAVADVAEEFYGDLFHTMTPENQPWVEYEAGIGIPEERKDEIEDFIKGYEKVLAKSLRASNYYDEGQVAFQDAVLGTVGIWGEKMNISLPITWEAIPAPEMFLRVGPRGIEDRFRRKRYFYRDLPVLFPNAKWPKELQDKIKKGGRGTAEVIWGFWRNYEDVANPIWRQEIRVDKKPIGLDEDLGEEGSCPFIVGRFNAVPNSAWGRGPALKGLPALRVLDEVIRLNLENMDKLVDPAFAYPHDGMLDLSEGIENGIGYPAMPGSAESITPIGNFGSLDSGFFEEDRLKESIRKLFFRQPEQKGKTPPSASQFMAEEQKEVRRMARPAGKLWAELGIGILRRVEYVERQNGGSLSDLDQPVIDGQTLLVRPISPLERAQAREEVITAQGIMQMGFEALGPEQNALLIDGPATMRSIKEKLKDGLVTFRTEDQIRKILQAQQQVQGAPVEQGQG